MANFRKLDTVWTGIVAGLVIPVISFIIYYHCSDYAPYVRYMWRQDGLAALLQSKGLMSQVSLVALLPNAAGVFAAYKLWLWNVFKGLLVVTVLLLVPCMYFFVW